MRGAGRRLHLASSAGACFRQPANLRPAVSGMTARSIKFRDCRRLSAPVVVVRSSATSAAKRGLVGVPRTASAESRLYCSGVISKPAHFSWNSATWIWCSRRIRKPGRWSSGQDGFRRLGVRWRFLAVRSLPAALALAVLHEFGAFYGTIVAVRKYEAYFVIRGRSNRREAEQRRSTMSVSTTFDLLLRGGRVIDPASGIDGIKDVAIRDGKIAAVQAGHPADQRPGDRRRRAASWCCPG